MPCEDFRSHSSSCSRRGSLLQAGTRSYPLPRRPASRGARPPAAASPIAGIAAIAGVALPAAQALAAPIARTAAELGALTDAARARLAKVDGAKRAAACHVADVEPVAQTTSSGFGWRDDPFRTISASTPAPTSGHQSGTPCSPPATACRLRGAHAGYGNVIFIDHGGGVVTRYGHMRRSDSRRRPGRGRPAIGLVGSTGRATGPHLHFEVRLDGRPVDPNTALAIAELARDTPLVGHIA